MKDLMNCADKYIKKCGWRDIALLKICVLALGIMVGLCISPNNKKSALWAAMAVFVVTYIPVMSDFLKFVAEDRADDQWDESLNDIYDEYDDEDCISF